MSHFLPLLILFLAVFVQEVWGVRVVLPILLAGAVVFDLKKIWWWAFGLGVLVGVVAGKNFGMMSGVFLVATGVVWLVRRFGGSNMLLLSLTVFGLGSAERWLLGGHVYWWVPILDVVIFWFSIIIWQYFLKLEDSGKIRMGG